MAEYKIYFDFKNDFAEQKSLTWRITSNPDDADVFVIEGLRLKDDEKAVLKHKPYLPVIYVGKNCRFKEFSIDEYFAPDLKQELHKIECVLKRIHELNDT